MGADHLAINMGTSGCRWLLGTQIVSVPQAVIRRVTAVSLLLSPFGVVGLLWLVLRMNPMNHYALAVARKFRNFFQQPARCFLEEVAEFSGNGKSIMILCIQAGLKTGKTLFPVLLNVVAVSPNARRTTPRFDGFPCADFYEKGR